MTLAQFEEGYRHGKRDYCVGIRSQALLSEHSEYADGYRAGLHESETIQAEWLKNECAGGDEVKDFIRRNPDAFDPV